MVCVLASTCRNYNGSFTCKVMDGGPRNELGHAYCGVLKEHEAALERIKKRVSLEA